MNWDGDHLHSFSVGSEHYGDPFYSPDLDDEEQLRLSGAFTSSTKTISYLYDFGASWYHDVTREKVPDLERPPSPAGRRWLKCDREPARSASHTEQVVIQAC